MKYVLFEHAGAGNHGCEAIVRSTVNMLGDNEYYLQTNNIKEDTEFGLSSITYPIVLKNITISPKSLKGIGMRIQSRLNSDIDYDTRESMIRNRQLLIKDSIALSIGGDNYCYAGIIHSMRDKLNAFKLKKIPVVLWGCSVDRDYLDKVTIEDLKKYALITVRESLSAEVLREIGVEKNMVLCADPAFTLPREKINWNKHILDSQNVIGINVSDFMKYYNSYPNATYNNFYNLLCYILKSTDNYIVLIPHVRQNGNDDLEPIKRLARELRNERILIVDKSYNCMQLKDIIARCRLFIGCRTHSTIAAYSSGVPTLVVGYSIKARGICHDIFGREDGLLVDVRKFESDNDLIYMFDRFAEQENEIKSLLKYTMPEYCQKAYNALNALKTVKQ